MKKLIITESQYKELIRKKRNEAKVANYIREDINKLSNKRLNESLINEGVVDVLKTYVRRGILTVGVIASLLASNHVNAQQLSQAGVSQTEIEQAQEQANKGGMDDKTIEQKIIKNLKRVGYEGTLRQFNALPPEQKAEVIRYVKSEVDKGKDINDVIIGISDFVNFNPGQGIIATKKAGEKLIVDTVIVQMTLPISASFANNSSRIIDENLKTSLQDSLNSFVKVDSIVIKASSSTLRNTGEAEGLTWKELSAKRADAVVQMLNGMSYNTGGCGANPNNTIDSNIIKIDINGTNGDGTSGPPSPYEVNPSMVQSYKERGIDPKFWDSNATGEPLANKADYNQYQYVNVVIYGHVVETHTEQIINYKYVVIKAEKKGGIVKKTKEGNKGVDISSCPIKIRS